jgi:hypothetical protein
MGTPSLKTHPRRVDLDDITVEIEDRHGRLGSKPSYAKTVTTLWK